MNQQKRKIMEIVCSYTFLPTRLKFKLTLKPTHKQQINMRNETLLPKLLYFNLKTHKS